MEECEFISWVMFWSSGSSHMMPDAKTGIIDTAVIYKHSLISVQQIQKKQQYHQSTIGFVTDETFFTSEHVRSIFVSGAFYTLRRLVAQPVCEHANINHFKKMTYVCD